MSTMEREMQRSSFGGDDTATLCLTQDRGHLLGGATSDMDGRGDGMDAPLPIKGVWMKN